MATSNGADEAALERSYSDLGPIDTATAEKLLIEAKHIMGQLEVVFFLRQGTCLGAIRDNALIPWDDDLDLGSVIGLNGLTEKTIENTIERVVSAFRANGFFAKVERTDHYINVALMKSSTRIDWACYRIIDDSVFHYPGVRIPVTLLNQLKEIDFIGEKFLVPNPPEEYLRFKYGPSWLTPMKSEWMKEVVEMIPESSIRGRAGRLSQLFTSHVLRWRACKLRVLDNAHNSVAGAEVSPARSENLNHQILPVAHRVGTVFALSSHRRQSLHCELRPPSSPLLYQCRRYSNARETGHLATRYRRASRP